MKPEMLEPRNSLSRSIFSPAALMHRLVFSRIFRAVAFALAGCIALVSMQTRASTDDDAARLALAAQLVGERTLFLGPVESFNLYVDSFVRAHFAMLDPRPQWSAQHPMWPELLPLFTAELLATVDLSPSKSGTVLAREIATRLTLEELKELSDRFFDPTAGELVRRLQDMGLSMTLLSQLSPASLALKLHSPGELQSAKARTDMFRAGLEKSGVSFADFRMMTAWGSPAFSKYQEAMGATFSLSVSNMLGGNEKTEQYEALLVRWRARIHALN